jgi:hypothetical protein
MSNRKFLSAAALVAFALSAPAAFAADQPTSVITSEARQSAVHDFQAAYAAAQQAEQQAAVLHDRWTPTETALKQAKQAADAKHFDEATAFAREAEALAKVSVQQAEQQETAWHEAVVH